jgi:hypothetical protein
MAAKRPVIATSPVPNPKLGDYLKAGGPSAKPPIEGRSTGRVPTNKRK